jgi:ankyrin repeat protein
LHTAVYHEQLEVISLLLETKNSVNTKGESPLSIAIDKENYDIAKILLENGANSNHKDTNGESLLHKTIYKRNNRITHMLLDYEADPTCKNSFDITPFYKLIHSDNPDADLVKKFLIHGVKEKEEHLWSIFCRSVRMKYYEIVEMLLEFMSTSLIRLARNDVLQIPLRCITINKDDKTSLLDVLQIPSRCVTTNKDDKMMFLFTKYHLYPK